MKQNINVILNTFAEAASRKDYDMIDKWIYDVIQKTYSYMIDVLLDLKEPIQEVRQGTLFSTFSPEEVEVVRTVDSVIAGSMHSLWFIDNSYCMHLDFAYEDYQRYGYASYSEYRRHLDENYIMDQFEVLREVVAYAEKKYASIMIDFEFT